jgi:hypothetical protein
VRDRLVEQRVAHLAVELLALPQGLLGRAALGDVELALELGVDRLQLLVAMRSSWIGLSCSRRPYGSLNGCDLMLSPSMTSSRSEPMR